MIFLEVFLPWRRARLAKESWGPQCARQMNKTSVERSRMAKRSTAQPPGEVTMEGEKGVGQPHEPRNQNPGKPNEMPRGSGTFLKTTHDFRRDLSEA